MNVRVSPPMARFRELGFRPRTAFPHWVLAVPKQYPDLFSHLQSMGFSVEALGAGSFRQLNLYALDLKNLAPELFTDLTINWHRQQLGIRGLVAVASLYLPGDGTMVVHPLQSDLCQQLFRREDFHQRWKSPINTRFGSWYKVIWNAVLDFALTHAIHTIRTPSAAAIVTRCHHQLDPALFERIYDGVALRYRCRKVEWLGAPWWELPVEENRDRVVGLEAGTDELRPLPARMVAVFHDIEENIDTEVSAEECRQALGTMLAAERAAGVATTYNVVGTLLGDKAPIISAASSRHALGFHSYDHQVMDLNQLRRSREVNLKIRGYRPARSVLTPELTDYRLSYYNIEWLLNDVNGFARPEWYLENGLVKIPVHWDDYPLQVGRTSYAEWKAGLLRLVESQPFVAVGLHDCYARHWLADYPDLLAELQQRAELWTCDEIADRCYREGDARVVQLDRPGGATRTKVSRETWQRFVRAARGGQAAP